MKIGKSALPTPITNEGYRILNTVAYEKRVLEDELMNDVRPFLISVLVHSPT
jgi:hypothetical protein